MSSTANPSRRNSGFHDQVGAGRLEQVRPSRAAVPAGTVDLPTTSAPGRTTAAASSMAAST